ncbi:hypothetical protein [Campylobacter corcagiensis]|uniref:Septum formation initiator n=1 Tax=Campylobacter corcagiensis TaxID=1448857 RepID=A0A7M1LHV1_9BACT|nr:hypothetical protein [Campylobacter corcagiensis]QKF65404.1 hypothetical protein CCORG_1567 [Campylobacter corcagiensis]QOQ88020.1 hypothetical protein IMC76_04310 [Campylobacter corcagiensis]
MSKENLKLIVIFLALAVIVIVLGVYAGNVLFGDRSLSVLKSLQEERYFLHKDINRLKDENARLQKLYLEREILDNEVQK